jgi:hypothetical protein
MHMRNWMTVIVLAVFALIGAGASFAQQHPSMDAWAKGFPISLEQCKTHVLAAYAAEGYTGLKDSGNGWLAWNRNTGATISCIEGNNETVVSIVTAGGNASAMLDRLTDQMSERSEGGMFITNTLSGKCMDVAGSPGINNGAGLQLYDCEFSGGPNGSRTDQKWVFTREGFIRNTLSKKCIDVSGAPGTNNGAGLQLYDCETSRGPNSSQTDQKWVFTREGFIRNTLSGKCIDVSGTPGTYNGAPLQLWNCETSGNRSRTDQKWQLKR